jgi:hypothetical protein
MVNDTTQPRTRVDYVPIHGLVISGLIAVIALGLSVVPAALDLPTAWPDQWRALGLQAPAQA